jgi:hypothetical protein
MHMLQRLDESMWLLKDNWELLREDSTGPLFDF